MALEIIWTRSALSDLEQIVGYIAVDDVEAARKFGITLIRRVEPISEFPKSGRIVPELGEDNLREIILTPYRIVYEIFDEEQAVKVLRIWHAARGAVEMEQ